VAVDFSDRWHGRWLAAGRVSAWPWRNHAHDKRAAHTLSSIAVGYAVLLVNRIFIAPSLAIGFIIGALYAFFGITPAIMLGTLALAPVNLGLFYAATVFVVFGAGMTAPRLVHRFGMRSTVLAGLCVALSGGIIAFLPMSQPSLWAFALAIVVFLAGFGVASPVLTASALQPFGRQAGLASALLGFVQMGGAAMATGMITLLRFSPFATLAFLLIIGSLLAILIFLFGSGSGQS
jgi:MFS transporter, DHA1 family, multidrug resistance protein